MRDTNTAKHRELMLDLIEKKIRLHARQLYEQRVQVEGHALEDWLKAESAVLKNTILAPLWHSHRQDRARSKRPRPVSYDSGYEHSLEHWIELQHLLCEDKEDANSPPLIPAHSSDN